MANGTQEMLNTPGSTIDPDEIELSEEELEMMQTAVTRLEARVDLEGSAHYSGALTRRRIIQTAIHLLRMVMVYALKDMSLRMVGLWGTLMEWGSLSKNGVRKRLLQCRTWLGMLVVLVLMQGKVQVPAGSQYRYRLIDVSNTSQPGSRKIDWRLHLDFGLRGIQGVQLTDRSVGESLTHWQFQPDDIVLADRIYGVLRSLGVLLGAMAYFVIRIGWQNLPVTDREGQPFSISDWLRLQSSDPAARPAEVKVWVNTPQGRFPIRLIARAIPPEKTEKIRQALRAEAKHKKRRQDERSLLAAGFVMVVSNLPEATWQSSQILALYRFRWQIELVFKRLKSLLSFDHLRTKDPQLAQVYLLTKILIALLIGEAQWRLALRSQPDFQDPEHPISQWRFTQLVLEAFSQSVCGSITWGAIAKHWHQLGRYLCDDPRRRKRQLVSLGFMGMVCGF